MKYVDGFIVPVPKKKLAAYKALARLASKVWRHHGALEYVEAAADDAPVGKLTSFPRSVKLKKTEGALFIRRLQIAQASRRGDEEGDG